MNLENVLRNAFRSQLNIPEQALAPNLTGKPPCPSLPLPQCCLCWHLGWGRTWPPRRGRSESVVAFG